VFIFKDPEPSPLQDPSGVRQKGEESRYKDRHVKVCRARRVSHPDSTSLHLFLLGTLHIFVLGTLARLGLFAASYFLPELPALYLPGIPAAGRQQH